MSSQSAALLSPFPPHKSMRETPKAAAAFREYCLLGTDRSLRKLADIRGTKLSQLGVWSRAHNWQERVKEYDAQIAEEKRKRRLAEVEKMDEEHALIGRTQLLRAVTIVQRHIEAQDTTLSSAVSLMKAAYELERLARGAATSRLEGDVSVMVLPKEYINIREDEEGSEA
jgi:hypothetical protein